MMVLSIHIYSSSYCNPMMRWKPQKTIDSLYQKRTLMAYNKKKCMKSKLKISQDNTLHRKNVDSKFTINIDGDVTLLRERKDKMYPNSIIEIKMIMRGKIFNVFKGSIVYDEIL